MDATGIILVLICILAWGSWLVPSQNVKFPTEQAKTFFVALATTIIAVAIVAYRGEFGQLSTLEAWIPLVGGLIWAISAYCAFVACNHIGVAKAFGTWAPLNVVTSFFWDFALFGKFRDLSGMSWLVAVAAFLVMTGGIFMIIFSGGSGGDKDDSGKSFTKGILGAIGAGILWGTFFVPVNFIAAKMENRPEISQWTAAMPLAVGMLIGTALMVIITGKAPKLAKAKDYVFALSSGGLWALGFFCMILTVAAIGAGQGYTLASLCVVVNAIWGVFYFKDPGFGSRAGKLTLAGVAVAALAGMALSNTENIDTKYKIAKGIIKDPAALEAPAATEVEEVKEAQAGKEPEAIKAK